jgi:diguanylate cyclase (GGDEF)-like protein/PAS domain S-box-containing protein
LSLATTDVFEKPLKKKMSVKTIELTEKDAEQLRLIIKKGNDWRVRERAQSILLLSEGQSVFAVSEKQGVQPETIRQRRKRWLKKGFASLADQARGGGAPCKLTAEHRHALQNWIAKDALSCHELHHRLKKVYQVNISVTTLRNELKRLGYVQKYAKKADTKRFKRDTTQLKQKDIEYQAIIEASFSGFWCNDTSGRFLSVNTAVCRMLGYSQQELLNMTIMDIEAAENPAETAAHIQTVIQTGHDRFETRHRCKDGNVIDVEINVLCAEELEQRFFVFVNDITERKQAQNALIASEDKYRTLFNSIQDGIVFVDMQGTILECNQCYADMLGYSEEELKKLTFYQISPEKWSGVHTEKIEKEVTNRGYCELFEKEYIRKDGTVFPVELRAWLRKDKQGNPQGRWAIVRDISKRKQIEDELRKSHNELQRYFDQPLIGMLSAAHDKQTLHVNQRFCDMIGYSEQEMQTIDWDEFTHPDDLAPNQAYLDQAIRGEIDSYQMEKRYINKDGHIVYVDLAVCVVRKPDGDPDYFIGMMLDISERKRVEHTLQENQSLLQTAQRAARMGYYIADLHIPTAITWTNDALFDEIFGIDAHFIRIFANWQCLIHPDDVQQVMAIFEQLVHGHARFPTKDAIDSIVYRIIRPNDGELRWIEAWGYNFYDDNDTVIQQVGVIQDITERKLVEQHIQESEQRLNLSQEYGGIGSWEADLINNRQIWSRTVYQILHFPALSNPTWDDFISIIHADDRQSVIDATQAHINQGTKYDVEYRAILTDGQIHWLRSAGQAQFAPDGTAVKFIGIVQDITHRKQIETELRIAATVFEAQEGMFITDANCVILKVNHAFTEITGYSTLEAIGRTPRFLQSGRHDKAFYAALWQSINDTGAWQGEIWNKRKNGECYPQWLTITAVKGNNDEVVTHYVATLTDITERKATEERINNLAFYDSLTQLPNRRLLQERLKHGIEVNHRTSGLMAVMMMDLDKFKAVNDSLGHAAGDLLLQQVAERIKARLREVDMVARLGGDEFVIVIEEVRHYEDVAPIAEAIIHTLSQAFILYDIHQVIIGASIGIAFHPQHGDSVEALIDNADTALYYAKDQGRGCFAYFSEVLRRKV